MRKLPKTKGDGKGEDTQEESVSLSVPGSETELKIEAGSESSWKQVVSRLASVSYISRASVTDRFGAAESSGRGSGCTAAAEFEETGKRATTSELPGPVTEGLPHQVRPPPTRPGSAWCGKEGRRG